MKPLYKFAIAIAVGIASAAIFHCTAKDIKSCLSKTVNVSDRLVSRRFDNLSEFSKVDVSRGIKVNYVVSDTRRAEARVGENVVDSLVCRVDGNTLVIGMKNNCVEYKVSSGDHLTVTVYGPSNLSKVSVSTSATFKAEVIDTDKLKLNASTSGDIEIVTARVTNLVADASTSGDVEIAKVDGDKVSLDATTCGDIEIDNLIAVNLKVDASTSGSVEIKNFDGSEAKLDASTSGDVRIKKATAIKLNMTASTSGDIEVSGQTHSAIISASTSGDVNVGKLKIDKVDRSKSTGGRITL